MKKELSASEMLNGRKRYLLFCGCNGFSVALLAESTLILYGLKIGIPDYMTGIMSSFILLGMPFMIVGKSIISRIGISKTLFLAWVTRSLCVLISVTAPFFMSKISFYFGIFIFMAGAYGFYAFRGIGVIGATPLVGEITDNENRAQYNAMTSLTYNSGYFISMVILINIFEYLDSVFLFQIIISIGSFLGITAAFIASKVPETETPKESASVSIKKSLSGIVKISEAKKLFFTQIIFQATGALLIPYSIIIMKVTYHIKDYKAMSFILVQMIGGITVALFTNKIVHKIGPKFFTVFLYFIFFIPTLMWIFSPVKFSWVYCAAIFFIGGFASSGGGISLTHYFLNAIPTELRISSMIVITAIASTIAGLLGSGIGGSILKIMNSLNLSDKHIREFYFLIIFLLSFAAVLLLLKIHRKSFSNIRIISRSNYLQNIKKMVFGILNFK